MRRTTVKNLLTSTAVLCTLLMASSSVQASSIYHSLAGGNFSQDWTNTGLITTSDDWSGVPSIEGYRGDDLTAVTNTDPQTIVAFSGAPAGPVLDVNANNTNPNTFATGGVTEFDTLANPVVAMQGSGTADAPFLIFYMDSTGRENVSLSYLLRDVDGSADNAAQQVALQYRIGNSGDFTNVPSVYIADATTAGSATQTTGISATDPAWSNVPQLQFRVITTNAGGNDEWVGVDDISVVSTPMIIIPEPASLGLMLLASLGLLSIRRPVR
jgi:hypothetical protein